MFEVCERLQHIFYWLLCLVQISPAVLTRGSSCSDIRSKNMNPDRYSMTQIKTASEVWRRKRREKVAHWNCQRREGLWWAASIHVVEIWNRCCSRCWMVWWSAWKSYICVRAKLIVRVNPPRLVFWLLLRLSAHWASMLHWPYKFCLGYYRRYFKSTLWMLRCCSHVMCLRLKVEAYIHLTLASEAILSERLRIVWRARFQASQNWQMQSRQNYTLEAAARASCYHIHLLNIGCLAHEYCDHWSSRHNHTASLLIRGLTYKKEMEETKECDIPLKSKQLWWLNTMSHRLVWPAATAEKHQNVNCTYDSVKTWTSELCSELPCGMHVFFESEDIAMR